MKKMILVAMLLLVAPAMAAVILSCDVDELATPPTLSIAYDSNEVELVRAFALDIEITGGATIDAVASVNGNYYIYPGTIIIDANGDVEDVGSPVAPANDPGALGALGGASITIEMGSLYEDGDANLTPAAAGGLIVLELGNLADGTVTVTTNETRARIVLEDSTVVDASTSCLIETAVAVCVGDQNGDGYITTQDITAIVTYLTNYASAPYWYVPSTDSNFSPAADVNGDGYVTTQDITALVTYLTNNASAPYWYVACP